MKTLGKSFFCAVGVALTLLVTPFFERARANAVRSSCQSNLKRIGLSHLQYVRDYDERFALTTNWQSALQPYQKWPPEVWRCPGETFSYVYNAHLEGISYGPVDKKEQITLVYEGATARRADAGQSWFPFAHGNGSNVLYMDAHVEWETQKPLFFLPGVTNPREWQKKQDAKHKAEMGAYWRRRPVSERPLGFR